MQVQIRSAKRVNFIFFGDKRYNCDEKVVTLLFETNVITEYNI